MAKKTVKTKPITQKQKRKYPSCPQCGKKTFPRFGGGCLAGTLICSCGWTAFN